jgi:hypothetical protein
MGSLDSVDNKDKEILQSLGHKIVSVDEAKKETVKLKEPLVQHPVKAQEKQVITENLVFRELQEKFGLSTIAKKDVIINDMTFTLRPLTARWLSWADATTLATLGERDIRSILPEYEAKLKIHIAGCIVDKINGQPITEIFNEKNERQARAMLIDFLADDSKDQLASKIYSAYDDLIEPHAKILSSLDSLSAALKLQAYICPKCRYAQSYEDGEYYCHKDGTKLVAYKLEAELPLP